MKKTSSKAIERAKKNELTREQFVWTIRNLPDIHMEYAHSILLSFAPEFQDGKIINLIRQGCINQAMWLEYYLLDRKEVLAELTFTSKIHHKPLAERTMAFYHLAQEIYPRSPLAQEQNLSPLLWTLRCEIDLIEVALRNSYFESRLHSSVGKASQYKKAVKTYTALMETTKLKFEGIKTVSHLQALEMEGAWIAKNNSKFRNSYWHPYCQKQKRIFRAIRDSPLRGILATPDGFKLLGSGNQKKSEEKGDRRL